MIDFVSNRYTGSLSLLEVQEEFDRLPEFGINENIWDILELGVSNSCMEYIRLRTQYYLTKAFATMKINPIDPNILEDPSIDNLGTPGRIAKTWVGVRTDADSNNEFLSGRWVKKPRVAVFDANTKCTNDLVITKRVNIDSVCSHHLAVFSSKFSTEAYCEISYKSSGTYIGISKLQRLVDWISRRGWLQEDLTTEIHKVMCDALDTSDVQVKLVNIRHTCEMNRGSMTQEPDFTTVVGSGIFSNAKN